ncbi:MAG: CbtB-domain containing protein [Rhizonema sp. NSF051]|nr:CbtB-domain containing protein [Rhizonema sp. NSF051]
MTTQSTISVQKKAADWTLSTPVQATLYVSLCALTLWTVYFTTYPPIHNGTHTLRHHTLLVSCH